MRLAPWLEPRVWSRSNCSSSSTRSEGLLLARLKAAQDILDRTGLLDKSTGKGNSNQQQAAAVIELIEPIQVRYRELESDPAETSRLLAMGAEKAREIAAVTMDRARKNVGLLVD